jgi:polyisoprenyl-phosphate glycosyltransferase
MKLSVIIPAYNEEGNVNIIYHRIKDVLDTGNVDYEIIFVNDGSIDKTKKNILDLIENDRKIKLISFTRNFGHQLALTAGYNHCTGDAAITMDCDLQHPPEMIPELIKKWEEGYEIVNTVRYDKNQKSAFKKYTSKYYYKFFSWITGVPIEEGSADYRLVDKKVISEIKRLSESEIFLRGMFYWFGFKSVSIPYTPNERYSGTTKYNLRKMVHFAINGITSFSVMPLKIVTFMGFFVSGLAILYMIYSMYSWIFLKDVISGWTSLTLSVLFLGGVQLISIGILGEYLGKIFIETKKRPRYVIDEING